MSAAERLGLLRDPTHLHSFTAGASVMCQSTRAHAWQTGGEVARCEQRCEVFASVVFVVVSICGSLEFWMPGGSCK